jgi:hypothetical protein
MPSRHCPRHSGCSSGRSPAQGSSAPSSLQGAPPPSGSPSPLWAPLQRHQEGLNRLKVFPNIPDRRPETDGAMDNRQPRLLYRIHSTAHTPHRTYTPPHTPDCLSSIKLRCERMGQHRVYGPRNDLCRAGPLSSVVITSIRVHLVNLCSFSKLHQSGSGCFLRMERGSLSRNC